MTDTPIPPGGLVVTETALGLQAQGQLRIWLAGIGGSLATAAAAKWHLPIIDTLWGTQGDTLVGMGVGTITLVGMSAWQWLRTRLQNARWWHLALDPRVPPELVRPAAAPAAK